MQNIFGNMTPGGSERGADSAAEGGGDTPAPAAGVNGVGSPPSTRSGCRAKTPPVMQHTTTAASSTSSAEVHELKKYIDSVMAKQLSAMEQRLMTAIAGAQMTASSSTALQVFAGTTDAVAPRDLPGPALPTVLEEGGEVPGAETAREEAKAEEQAAKKHEKEMKQREKFMAKYSSKEIFGEREDSACLPPRLSVPTPAPNALRRRLRSPACA